MKESKRKKAKVKAKAKKARRTRYYLREVNHYCAQLSAALRNLADQIDNVRSHHLDDEEENIR